MKKNIMKLVFASAFALVAGYSVYASQKKVEMSDLTMANVEALAQNESGEKYTKSTGQCPDPISYKRWVSCKRGGKEECYPSDC